MACQVFFLVAIVAAIIAVSQSGTEPTVCQRHKHTEPSQEEIDNFVYDPEEPESGPYYEGDIEGDIPEDLYDRNGIIGKRYRWPDNTVIYAIEGNFTKEQIDIIHEAQKHITEATDSCVKFREKTAGDGHSYVAIVNGNGCSSMVGYRGHKQPIRYADNCFRRGWGPVAHEHVHALGFFHEQSREDRDDYITVVWENIKKGRERQFCKHPSETFGEPYDYESIMHYRKNEFQVRRGKDTLIPKKEGVEIGQRTHISPIDVNKIKKMYGCS